MKVEKTAVTDPEALKRIMQSLQRLMKIGIYYPSGHSVLDRATEQFRHNLTSVAGDNTFIRFTIHSNNLSLQGINLDPKIPFVTEFRQTLTNLGIKHLEIDREIASSEIHRFIRSLLAFRTQFKSTKQFVQINLDDLPFSVRISQAAYLSAETAQDSLSETAAGSQPTIEVLLESLAGQGLTNVQLSQCRQMLEAISISTFQYRNEKITSPQVTWSDVERLILNLVKNNEPSSESTEAAHSQRNLNAIASILKTLEKSSSSAKSLEAIDLLVSLVKKPSQKQTSTDSKKKERRKIETDDLPVSDIENYITENILQPPLLKSVLQPDRREILTIVMQLFNFQHSLQTQIRMQQIVRDILTTPLNFEEYRILSKGVNQLLKKENLHHLPITLMMIIGPLRRSEHASSLEFLEQVSCNCSPQELKILFPYIINEILSIGSQEDSEIFKKLCDIALFLPSPEFSEAIPVLEKLDSFSNSKIAVNLFFSMSSSNYSLFAPLLRTSIGGLLAKRIIQGFKHKPPHWIIESLLPLLDSRKSLHRKFLYEYLKNSRFSEPTKSTKYLAGQIIVQTLPEISTEQRKDSSIIKTIRAMSQLEIDGTHVTLQSINKKKCFLIIPDWPAACRKAARDTLTHLQKK